MEQKINVDKIIQLFNANRLEMDLKDNADKQTLTLNDLKIEIPNVSNTMYVTNVTIR